MKKYKYTREQHWVFEKEIEDLFKYQIVNSHIFDSNYKIIEEDELDNDNDVFEFEYPLDLDYKFKEGLWKIKINDWKKFHCLTDNLTLGEIYRVFSNCNDGHHIFIEGFTFDDVQKILTIESGS